MNVLSVCSGIGTDALAFAPLGWRHVAFAEVDAFPSAVLAHRFPLTPNLGDFTQLNADSFNERIDLLCGGTPCQDFSVAGRREGLAGERGNLSLSFIQLAYRLRPRYVVWENVPGVLSSNGGRDFACFISQLAGLDIPIPPPPKGWKNSGFVGGDPNSFSLSWRTLDAQYFGVPQRRRRVFVVGSFGNGRCGEVLLNGESMSWDSPPSRQTQQNTPAAITDGFRVGGHGGYVEGCGTLRSNGGDIGGGTETLCVTEDGLSRCDTSGEGKRRDWETTTLVTSAFTLRDERGRQNEGAVLEEQAHTLHRMKGLSESQVVAFSAKDHGADALTDCSPTLRAGGFDKSHANSGNWCAIAFNGDETPKTGIEVVPTQRREQGGEKACVATQMKVRRLTPRECERLQGLPDDWTLVPWRKGMAPDGPRYKAIGNGWALPVARWVAERIAEVEKRG